MRGLKEPLTIKSIQILALTNFLAELPGKTLAKVSSRLTGQESGATLTLPPEDPGPAANRPQHGYYPGGGTNVENTVQTQCRCRKQIRLINTNCTVHLGDRLPDCKHTSHDYRHCLETRTLRRPDRGCPACPSVLELIKRTTV